MAETQLGVRQSRLDQVIQHRLSDVAGLNMIPDSVGTNLTTYVLAGDYPNAPCLAATKPRNSSNRPVWLRRYHAAELFLKTNLPSTGESIEELHELWAKAAICLTWVQRLLAPHSGHGLLATGGAGSLGH